ncbi:MAG: 50S ribosomal protein L6, partial [Phycisphaerales bacterium]|nr:50S ribosomal protein L6 [Phycisphaerales bacterium]
MSLIGKRNIPVPAGVEISIDAHRNVTVKGAKGTLTMTHRPELQVAHDADAKVIAVTLPEGTQADKTVKAYWGLTRS